MLPHKRYSLMLIALLAVLMFVISACSSGVATYESGAVPNVGEYSVQYPDTWIANDSQFNGRGVLLASSQTALNALLQGGADTLGAEDAGVTILVRPNLPLPFRAMDNTGRMRFALRAVNIDLEDTASLQASGINVTAEISAMTIGGKEAARTSLRTPEGDVLAIGIDFNPGYVLLLGGTAPDQLDNFEATFMQIAEGIAYTPVDS
jgi:hypothetical protein